MIEIVPYNPQWPKDFNTIALSLRTALADTALRIDHIGSTSVPGLAAKDKIDIQATVGDLSCKQELIAKLGSIGYTRFFSEDIDFDHRPPLANGPDSDWAKFLFVSPADQRPTNLHIRAAGKPNQRYPILFRDYLRSHPIAAEAYALIKLKLAQQHPDDIEFYYDIKDPFCDVIFSAAEEWAQWADWTMGPSDG